MLLSSTSSMKIKEKKTDKPALAGFIGLFVGNYFTAFFAVYSSGFSVSFATSIF